jgi:hypothetical protein
VTPSPAELSVRLRQVQIGLLIATIALVLAHLAFVQVAFRKTQRFFRGRRVCGRGSRGDEPPA